MKGIQVIFLILLAASSYAQTPDDNRNLNGVWLYKVGTSESIKGPDQSYSFKEFRRSYPFIQGVLNPLMWRDLEPSPGKFSWDAFDKSLNAMADAGLYINLMVWVGPHSPAWLYTEAGIARVITTNNKMGEYYPDYKNIEYKRRWYLMLDAVADRIHKLPARTRSKIVIFQSAEGTTGDETPFKGIPLNPELKDVDQRSEWWTAFRRDAWKHLYDLYKAQKDLNIHVLINGMDNAEELSWTNKHTPDIWRKANNMGHVYQGNGDVPMKDFFDPLVNVAKAGSNSVQIRCRDEFDVHLAPSYGLAPAWFSYWTALHALYFGVDIWSVHNNAEIFDKGNLPAFQFFQKYGGFKDPVTSPGAFCALRDGLDANDFERFPEKDFGPGSSSQGAVGRDRALKIAKAFESRGARQDDPAGGQGGPVNNLHAKAINDVNWDLFSGNYERYITQYSPNETSVGYWRLGSPGEPQGRFARGFDHLANKDTMFFNVSDELFNQFPLNGTQKIVVHISYYDNEGKWQLVYDATDNKAKVAFSQNNSNSGRWKCVTVTLSDAYFGNRLTHSADLALVNMSNNSENAIFHMVEITKK